MLLLDINHQKVLFFSDRKGNQVKGLNDPVTVSGSNIWKTHCLCGEKGR